MAYYPVGGVVDVKSSRQYSSACWECLIKILEDDVAASLSKRNRLISLVNSSVITDQIEDQIIDLFRDLKALDYGVFTAEDRIRLLSYFASGSMRGNYFNENEEGFALKLIKYADVNQADYLIVNLEKAPVLLNDPEVKTTLEKLSGSLLRNLTSKINDGIWGIGGNHSKEFTQRLVHLLDKSVNQLNLRLANTTTPEIILVQNSYLSPSDNESILFVRYINDNGKELLIAQGRYHIEQRCTWVAELGGEGYENCEIIKSELRYEPEIRLKPFDLIAIAKESDITLIEGIKPVQTSGATTATGIRLLPALAAEYAHREGDMRNVATYVTNSLDAMTLVVPFSKVATAPRWLNRFFKFTDVFSKVNAITNLLVNNTYLKDQPEVRELLDLYNSITLGINVANLATGLSRVKITRYIQLLEKPSLRKAFRDAASNGATEAQEMLDAAEGFKKYGEKYAGGVDWWKAEDVVQGAGNWQKIKNSIANRIVGKQGWTLKYTDNEIQEIITHGKGINLPESEIEDIIFNGCRPDKSFTKADLISQSDFWNTVKQRGYPSLFQSLQEYDQFSDVVKNLATEWNLPVNSIYTQGSSLRISNVADIGDLDIAIKVDAATFDNLVARFKANTTNVNTKARIGNNGKIGGVDMFKSTDVNGSFIGSFYTQFESAFGQGFQSKIGVPSIQISIVKEGSSIDVSPFLKLK